jgi:hypothetical protein
MQQDDRRRVPRYRFAALTDLAEAESSVALPGASVIELSRFGCLIQTPTPLSQGTKVEVRITHAGAVFDALGRVAYSLETAMGVVFSTVEPDKQAILEEWLNQEASRGEISYYHL